MYTKSTSWYMKVSKIPYTYFSNIQLIFAKHIKSTYTPQRSPLKLPLRRALSPFKIHATRSQVH